MSAALKPLDAVLQPVLQRLSPVPPNRVPLEFASSAVAVDAVRALRGVPERAIALRSGLAVTALDLVGASPLSPVILASRPPAVAAGSPLPEGCDAVVYPSAVGEVGAMLVASDAAAPGLNARLAGQDLMLDAVVVPAGQRLTPEAMLACRLAGIGAVSIRKPRVSVQLDDEAHAAWIDQRLTALGCATAVDASQANLVIRDSSQSIPRLALQPGDTAALELTPDGVVRVELPPRFDGVLAGYVALVMPTVGCLVGLAFQSCSRPLTRKLSSSIGMTELALLRSGKAGYEPLAVGDVPLSAVAQADAFMLIPPAAEGHAAGEIVAAIRLTEPFGLDQPEGSP